MELTWIKADKLRLGDRKDVKVVSEAAGQERPGIPFHEMAAPPVDLAGNRRLRREWRTMAVMVGDYCRARHGTDSELCGECEGLLDYATLRLERCRFGAEKPTCANCPVHCYERRRREQMKQAMRYAGPRMLWRHPVLSLRHWLDGFRKAPPL